MADCTACLVRPAPDARICPGCTDQLANLLKQVPSLHAQLHITLTRQARMGDRGGARSTDTPVVFEQRASVDLETMRTDLSRWAHGIAAHRGITVDQPTRTVALIDGTTATIAGPPDVVELARWLLRWVGAAAQHPDAAEFLDELRAMVQAAERTIDRAPDLHCLGPCDVDGCPAWLYVPLHAQVARCPSPDCDAEYDVAERRAWLLEQTVDRLMTAAEIARDLPWIAGLRIDRKLINKWAGRDRIRRYDPHPADPHAAPRFRVGEVLELLRDQTGTSEQPQPDAAERTTGAA